MTSTSNGLDLQSAVALWTMHNFQVLCWHTETEPTTNDFEMSD